MTKNDFIKIIIPCKKEDFLESKLDSNFWLNLSTQKNEKKCEIFITPLKIKTLKVQSNLL